jgi:cell migration-inducing and hyaluronan-binding protein
MRVSLASRLRFAAVLLIGLAACNESTAPAPPAPPPPPPAPPPSLKWSDPATWPGGAVPVAGAAVTIAAGQTVYLDVSPPALASLTVDGTLRFEAKDLNLTSGWILVRGRFEVGTESEPYLHRAIITLTGPSSDDIQGIGAKVLGAINGGAIELHGEKRVAWTRLAATAAAGATQLQLERTVDWRPGDHLVLASTDFDPTKAEETYVTAVQGSQVTVSPALRHSHFGVTQNFAGRTLDERAEVGLLSRNIVVRGDEASESNGFGGHILATAGGILHVEGIELTRMGQKKVLARYPMHWHMQGVTTGQYFKDSAIWHTFNRCVTVHGTRNVRVSGNVCHDNIGHSYFLEDGAETGNVFEDNLAVLTQKPANGQALIPSDVTPAAYWITNPANVFRRNVAAGSRGFGFWFAFPAAPTGLSTGQPDRPRETPLGEFTDNVAHSNSQAGLQVDQGPMADLTLETVHYSPRQVPGTSSPAVTANFRNFTGYKHPGRAVWLRGTELRLPGAMLADNAIGATFASNETFVTDAVFVGQSANNGGTQIPLSFPIRGYEFYDGRVGAERVTFVNFQSGGGRTMSALGFNRANGFPVNTGNYDNQISLVNSNAVFLEDPASNKDGDKAAVILDNDGSVTGTAGAYVAANNPIMITPACTYRPAWNAWVCTQRFVQLQVRGLNSQSVAPLGLERDDQVRTDYVGVPDQPQTVAASVVPGRGYSISYTVSVPDRVQFVLSRTNAGEWARITAPYPGILFNVVRDNQGGSPLAAAASLAALDASQGELYYYDALAGKLHLKLFTRAGRTSTNVSIQPK